MIEKPYISQEVKNMMPNEEGIIYQAPDCNCAYIYDECWREWLRCPQHDDGIEEYDEIEED